MADTRNINPNNDPSQSQSSEGSTQSQNQSPRKKDRLFHTDGPTAAESANDRARRSRGDQGQSGSTEPADSFIDDEQRDRQGQTPGSQADGEF